MTRAITSTMAATFLALFPGTTTSTSARPAEAGPVPLQARPFFFALSVADVEASREWYGRVFGFETIRVMDLAERGVRIRLLAREGAFLELVELEDARRPSDVDPELDERHLLHGLFKAGFEVMDLDLAVARLEALGVELRGQPFNEPDGSMRSAQIEDPDGNVLQLFEIFSPEETSPRDDTAFSPERVVEEVSAAEAALVEANGSDDPMEQFRYYAEDYVYIDAAGKRVTKAELQSRRTEDQRTSRTEASELEVLPITQDAAVTRGRWDDHAVYYGALPRVSSSRYLALWRKREGGWVLVADQATPIVERQVVVRERVELSPQALKRFQGTFRLSSEPEIEVVIEAADAALLLAIPGEMAGLRFFPSGDGSFFARERPWELEFDPDAGSLVLTTWGIGTPGHRIE